jgi:hypothetical protein
MTRPLITPGPLHSFRTASPDYAPEFGIYADSNPAETIVRTTGEHAAANAEAFAALPDLLEALERIAEWEPTAATDEAGGMYIMSAIDLASAALLKAGYTL